MQMHMLVLNNCSPKILVLLGIVPMMHIKHIIKQSLHVNSNLQIKIG